MGAKGLPSQILLDCCGEAMLPRSWRFLETLECLTALACWHPWMPPPNCVQWMPLSGRGNGGRVVTLTARPLFSALLWQPRALERRHRILSRCRVSLFGLLTRGDSPEPRPILVCLRVAHNAPDYFAEVISHVVIVWRPVSTTATLVRRNKNELLVA